MKQKNVAAQEMARLRSESLTPKRRRQIARGAVAARWAKERLSTASKKAS